MTPADPSRLPWHLAETVRWRDWDGEIVAYNDRTGDTHHFVDICAWIFQRLALGAASAGDVETAAESAIELAPGSELTDAVERSFALFRKLRLIEPGHLA